METYQNTAESLVKADFPWLIFQMKGNHFAVNSEHITGILQMPEQTSAVPDASPFVRGIFNLRGAMVSLLDLRKVFGYSTLQDEYGEFVDMLEQRKQDHLLWVKELERSVEENERFTLATDPHKCAFGKWYDHFHSDLDSVNLLMGKIEEPHRKLHEAAIEVEDCTRNHDSCNRDTCLKKVFEQVKGEYVPKVLALLDNAKEVFRSSYQEMVVVLEDEENRIGVIVDSVLAVDQVQVIQTENFSGLYSTDYVAGVASCKSVSGNILLLDEEKLLNIF